jgi:hypothetical protein
MENINCHCHPGTNSIQSLQSAETRTLTGLFKPGLFMHWQDRMLACLCLHCNMEDPTRSTLKLWFCLEPQSQQQLSIFLLSSFLPPPSLPPSFLMVLEFELRVFTLSFHLCLPDRCFTSWATPTCLFVLVFFFLGTWSLGSVFLPASALNCNPSTYAFE